MNTSCASQNFPFEYYDVDGEVVNGTLINGSCIFEDANCDPNLPGKDCCDYNPDFTKTMLGSYGSMVNFLPILPVFWIFYRLRQSLSEEERQAIDEEESKKSKPAFIRESKLPEWLKNWLYGVWYFGFGLQIVASIPVMIYLKRTQQSVMSTAQRTTLAAAEAFFEPFYTIFTFVEDIILVRVMYSISSGNKGLTDRLVHMGLAGVTVTGIAGGIVATILGVVPQSVRALTIPGQENDMRLFPGCQFVETVDPSIILPFWLMESWACWGMQLKNVLSGFLIGAEDWYAVGWLGAISIGAFALTWFPFYATFPNPITLLGIAEFIQDWSWPFILWLYLKTWGSGVSERTGLDLSLKKVGRYLLVPFDIMKKKFSKASTEDDDDDDSDIAATNTANNNNDNDISETQRHRETKNLIKQGISLMVTDITLEGCKAAAIYLSLLANNAVTYQMTALFSELPQFGLAGILFAKMMLGVFGPMLLAIAHPRFFVEFSYIMLATSVLIIGISVALAIPSNDGLAITSGKNACVFASSTECVPYFNEVCFPDDPFVWPNWRRPKCFPLECPTESCANTGYCRYDVGTS